ncbi:hypothetical protein PUN28_003086 [Cardiocondyla obscurior]|uniref:Uncharacterized protein n=1 Tax=Cardiocondyla obscurior TaxID=286306 RepID=A0AAW2GIR9_9HYME
MRATHDGAEIHIRKKNLSNHEEYLKVGKWLVERNTGNQQQKIKSSAVFYKCTVNNIDNLNQLPTNAIWLKGTATKDVNLLPESKACRSIFSADMSQNSINNKDSMENLIEFRQVNDTKTLEEHKESVKRIKQPENWKVNIKKNARLKGEEYIGVGGKIVPAKKMGQPCLCRMHCSYKIDEKEREELHKAFWKNYTWQQRKQYIASSVKESPKQRTRLRNVRSEPSSLRCRQVTFTYSLLLKDKFITVCKSMFLSTFALSEKFVRHVMKKKRMSTSGILEPDQRGRHTPKTKKSEDVKERVREHIRSFPTEKPTNPNDHSGICYLNSNLNIAAMHKLYVLKCKQEDVYESEIVKESYYREIFKTEFNLGFKRVKIKGKKLSGIS